jgi:hypothetical protein
VTSFVYPGFEYQNYGVATIPGLPLINLRDDERAAIERLQHRMWSDRPLLLLNDAYYKGEQVMTNLGIALPPELTGLRVILGWPRIAVDPYIERLRVDSFRLATADSADETLSMLRLVNGLESEESLSFTDALVMGRGWLTIGRDEDDGPDDLPDVCAESPLNLVADYDSRSQMPKAALQTYYNEGRQYGAYYLPNETIHLAMSDQGQWEITFRDEHNFGFVPVVRVANRPRANQRYGVSEISNELKSITDAACRTLLNLTAASEFYSVPQKLILGATEEDFVDKDGNKKSAWETYIGRVLALQRDAEGALPEVHQFQAYDPSVFTKVLEMYASQAAGILGAPPQDLGLYTQGNPISAEAAQVNEARRDRRARHMQAHFGKALAQVGQISMRFMNNGDLPAGYEHLAVDWQDPQIPNLAGMADAYTKLMTEGALPRQHDAIMRRLGFNDVERRQMLRALESDPAAHFIAEVGSAVTTRAIRAASVMANAASRGTDPADSAAPNGV